MQKREKVSDFKSGTFSRPKHSILSLFSVSSLFSVPNPIAGEM